MPATIKTTFLQIYTITMGTATLFMVSITMINTHVDHEVGTRLHNWSTFCTTGMQFTVKTRVSVQFSSEGKIEGQKLFIKHTEKRFLLMVIAVNVSSVYIGVSAVSVGGIS